MTRFARWLDRAEGALLAAAILVIAALTIVNVFCRTVLGFSLAWTEEMGQFLMIWLTFVGVGHAAARGRHIRMSALADLVPPDRRRWLLAAMQATTAALLVALTVFAVHYVATVHALGSVSPALRLPLWAVYSIAPAGLALAAVHYVLAAVRNVRGDEPWRSWTVRDRPEALEVTEL